MEWQGCMTQAVSRALCARWNVMAMFKASGIWPSCHCLGCRTPCMVVSESRFCDPWSYDRV